MLNRPAIVPPRAEGIIHHDRHTRLVRDLADCLEIRNIVPGIPNRLHIHRLGPLIDRLLEIRRRVARHELGVHAQPRHEDLELVVRAAVEIGRRDDVVAGVAERRDRHELGGLAGRGGQGGHTPLEGGDALLEHVDGGVHHARVDVAELLEAEEPRAVGGVIEDVGGGGVDGRGAGFGCGIWIGACMFVGAVSSCAMRVYLHVGACGVPACSCNVSNRGVSSSPPIARICSLNC